MLLVAVALTSSLAFADLGFRFVDGRCVNAQGEEGHNPTFLGPCADLRGAVLGRLDLSGFDLRGSLLDGADLRTSKLVGAKLEGASLVSANLTGVDFAEADFTNAKLDGARLRLATGYKANFTRTVLVDADMSNASFDDALFVGADLSRAKLKDASFDLANLSDARLPAANLRNAILTSTDLRKADLSGADLRSADLSSATLDQALLTSAIFNRRTILALSEAEAIAQGMVLKNGARHYRLRMTSTGTSSGFTGLNSIRLHWDGSWQVNNFANGSATGTIGGLAVKLTSSSVYDDAYQLSEAFDNDGDSGWYAAQGSYAPTSPFDEISPQWAQVSFLAEEPLVDGVELQQTSSTYGPDVVHVEESDDGTAWTPVEGASYQNVDPVTPKEIIWEAR